MRWLIYQRCQLLIVLRSIALAGGAGLQLRQRAQRRGHIGQLAHHIKTQQAISWGVVELIRQMTNVAQHTRCTQRRLHPRERGARGEIHAVRRRLPVLLRDAELFVSKVETVVVAKVDGSSSYLVEDIESIVAGIVGQKGRVHVSFGAPITEGFSDPDELAALIDKAIWSSYRLFPGNYLAADVPGKASTIEQTAFLTRQSEVPEEHKAIWRAMYAKPVENASKV